jgi:hypothetical protein
MGAAYFWAAPSAAEGRTKDKADSPTAARSRPPARPNKKLPTVYDGLNSCAGGVWVILGKSKINHHGKENSDTGHRRI